MASANATPRGTVTTSFGVGRREGHDSSKFYERFAAPELSTDESIHPTPGLQLLEQGDSRNLPLPDASVALVVTSPPYFVGKEYEQALGRDGDIPTSYIEYLEMLYDVFAECVRVLEPGGRIAVNIANLGRKPYRSLSADVIDILQNRLQLLLRGEVIWKKAEGASGNCAWGSFRSAANPVLRDLTERVVIASKGRFDRAIPVAEREKRGLPHENSLTSDEFMEATLDVWEFDAESATRVNHPAPFPVELPLRLIHLLTYKDDVVVDPFLGSGSTAVAAARAGRSYAGFDLDQTYVDLARVRVAQEGNGQVAHHETLQVAAVSEGKTAQGIAEELLVKAGFKIISRKKSFPALGIEVSLVAADQSDVHWYFDVTGAYTVAKRSGLCKIDTTMKALGKASLCSATGIRPHVLLTTHLPEPRSASHKALHAAGCHSLFDVIEMLTEDGNHRLGQYAKGGQSELALLGFWSEQELRARG